MYHDYLKILRETSPSIHVITNLITNGFVADTLLAIGCRPIMAIDPRESPSITASAQGLCINTGTPHGDILKSYRLSLEKASELEIPTALDFPGVGASGLRLETASSLFTVLKNGRPSWSRIIRGNGSEILTLAAGESRGRSIDSDHDPQRAAASGKQLLDYVQALCISGPSNHILGTSRRTIRGGSPLMARSTGFGCMATALMTAFLTVKSSLSRPDFEEEAVAAVCTLMHDAAQGIKGIRGPASFRISFIDSLFTMTEQTGGEK